MIKTLKVFLMIVALSAANASFAQDVTKTETTQKTAEKASETTKTEEKPAVPASAPAGIPVEKAGEAKDDSAKTSATPVAVPASMQKDKTETPADRAADPAKTEEATKTLEKDAETAKEPETSDKPVEKTADQLTDAAAPAAETKTEAKEDINTNEEAAVAKSDNKLENYLVIELKDGTVVVELRPDLAPNHVARIKELARQSFYNDVVFHRVIEGFMAQTGDPTGTGRGGSGKNLKAEFSNERHVRGTVSMARAADPDSADSQFYIMFDEAPHLDTNYTIFGKVVSGIEAVDKIKKGSGPNGMVADPDKMLKVRVAADIAATELPEMLKNIANGAADSSTASKPKAAAKAK